MPLSRVWEDTKNVRPVEGFVHGEVGVNTVPHGDHEDTQPWRRNRISRMQLPDQSPQDKGKILTHDAGIGAPDDEMVERRARELAAIAGLSRDESFEDFRAQAVEELRGTADLNVPNDDDGLMADLTAEDDVIGESGGATPPATNAATHGDEQTIGEQLYTEGIDEADHDRMTSSREEEARRET